MGKRTWLVAVLATFVGAVLGTTVTVYSQSRASALSDLAQQKQDVSRMQWVLLNAEVDALEWTSIRDFSRPVTPANFTYDEKAQRIIAAAFVDPTWLAQTNLEKVKLEFMARVVDLCALDAGGALMKDGSPAVFNWRDVCSVRFYTMTSATANDLPQGATPTVKDVAFYQNGQLTLK